MMHFVIKYNGPGVGRALMSAVLMLVLVLLSPSGHQHFQTGFCALFIKQCPVSAVLQFLEYLLRQCSL